MSGFLSNRVFWIGASVPIAVATALLGYGALRGPHTSAAVNRSSGPVSIVPASSMSSLTDTPTTALPASLDAAVSAINTPPGPRVPAALATGSVDSSKGHLLLSDVGAEQVSVYAATTDTGEVCLFDTSGPAGCIDTFDAATPIAWVGSMTPGGAYAHIVGLVPDQASGVVVVEGGTQQQATLRNDAFFIEPTSNPTAMLVTYANGAVESVPLPSVQHEASMLRQIQKQAARRHSSSSK